MIARICEENSQIEIIQHATVYISFLQSSEGTYLMSMGRKTLSTYQLTGPGNAFQVNVSFHEGINTIVNCVKFDYL